MTKSNLPSFQELSKELNKQKIKVHPSQLHGIFCGLLAGKGNQMPSWPDAVALSDAHLAKVKNHLQSLFDASEQQFKDFLFELELFLPDDEQSLQARAEALTLWCQGFFTGLEFVGVRIKNHAQQEVAEAMDDLIEITKMNYEEVVATDEDEDAYIELVEYVRMAAIMIYQSLQHPDEAPKRPSHLH